MNPKQKSENYQQFGGINQKASPYVLSPFEWLDLTNFDFQTIGSLTMRWGSTMYMGQTFQGPITALNEFTTLTGPSMVLIGHTGGLWFGATTGNHQGISLVAQGVTQSWGGIFADTLGTGLSSFIDLAQGVLWSDKQTVFGLVNGLSGNVSVPMFYSPLTHADNTESFAAIDNFLFGADGNKFYKFNGQTLYSVGLPYTTRAATLLPQFAGPSLIGLGYGGSIFGTTAGHVNIPIGIPTGTLFLYLSYVNNRGYEGPLTPVLQMGSGLAASASYCAYGFNVVTPAHLGVSAINQYRYFSSSTAADSPFLYSPFYLSTTPASGSTVTWVDLGTTIGGPSLAISTGDGPPIQYFDLGSSLYIGQSTYFGAGRNLNHAFTEYDHVKFYPRILETYQNRLFLSGFSSTPSDVWFSDVGEPEGYQADWNFEVRTNDSDIVSALKSYGSQLYIFKNRSFHLLTGDNPNNFFLRQMSDQYGCLNNRCAVVYNDILLFLDQKGVIQWNGSSLQVLSTKYQPIFDRMNYAQAKTTACMVHDKLRNQVLIAIPIDGSLSNNITVVYDYLANAWTSYKGFTPSVFATIQGRNTTKNVFYGTTTGVVNWFGSSFLSDNGVGFTTFAKTRFLHDLGDSTQKMFRQIFMNIDAPSATLVFSLNFYQNYGSSIVLSTTLGISQFQNRLQFGISAKSLAFEMSNIQTSDVLRIHGFTVESRYLRSV